MARPTKYHESYAERAGYLCARFGATDEDLAHALGVSVGTVANWRREHAEFLGAIEAGKRAFDDGIVQGSLLTLCRPRWVVTEKWDSGRKNEDGTTGAIVRLWQYRDPDPRAIALWMHNRQGWIFPGGKGDPGSARPVGVLGAGSPPGTVEDGLAELDDAAKEQLRQVAVEILESRHGTTIKHVDAVDVTDDAGDADDQRQTD